MGKFAAGDRVAARSLLDAFGRLVAVPDGSRVTHLQFRRFAGCPVCNLHLRSFVRRIGKIEAAGVQEVVVFHSTPEEMRQYEADLPFAVIGDAERKLYRAFGVESSPRALTDPRVYGPILKAVVFATVETIRRRRQVANANPHGGRLGLPADFLIAPEGSVMAAKYGEHADDQWSVDEVLALVGAAPRPSTSSG
jgi:peroxiredoxin